MATGERAFLKAGGAVAYSNPFKSTCKICITQVLFDTINGCGGDKVLQMICYIMIHETALGSVS